VSVQTFPTISEIVKMQTANLVWPKVCLTIVWLVLAACSAVAEKQAVLLWPNGAPGSEGKTADEIGSRTR